MRITVIIYLEKLHRYVFDNLYVQGYEITFKDRLTLFWYKILSKQYPNWRKELQKEFPNCSKYKRYGF